MSIEIIQQKVYNKDVNKKRRSLKRDRKEKGYLL